MNTTQAVGFWLMFSAIIVLIGSLILSQTSNSFKNDSLSEALVDATVIAKAAVYEQSELKRKLDLAIEFGFIPIIVEIEIEPAWILCVTNSAQPLCEPIIPSELTKGPPFLPSWGCSRVDNLPVRPGTFIIFIESIEDTV